MKINANILIEDLKQLVNRHLEAAKQYQNLRDEVLNKKSDPKSWSILECLEHLNLYGDFYLPEIKKQMEKRTTTPSEVFKSGWLGNYFANAMLPVENMKTMATFKDKDPINSDLDRKVLDRFIEQQEEMLRLLEQAKTIDLNRVKTGITITRWITLRLGDTFRFVINHNERHIVQANKI